MPKVLTTVECFELQPINNILRIDGAPICQVLVNRDGRVWLRFMDTDRYRNQARGDRYIEVPLDVFIEAVEDCS